MDKAELAVVARLEGDRKRFIALSKEALALEIQAADLLRSQLDVEPTRSILFRSAASIALDCDEYRTAERLLAEALAGFPPDGIAEELRELLDRVHFSRHLDLRGVQLAEDEFQMSMTGNSIGPGIADSDEFVTRVKATETIIYRTAERQLHKPFREHGRRRESLKNEVELFISVPRAASFAVSFKVGHSKQIKLPTMNFGEALIDEVLACLDLIANDQQQKLQKRIPEAPYYRNFVALANEISPDGHAINMVGFTAQRGKTQTRIVLTGQSTTRSGAADSVGDGSPTGDQKIHEFRGRLKYADERHLATQRVQLIGQDGTATTIHVPSGMMADIVTPYWGRDVTVLARHERKRFVLESIHGRKRIKRRS